MNTPNTPAPHPRAAGGRSLVLGGGGLVGIAWLVGVVSGLADEGLDLVDAAAPDATIGTSAGSIVGAFLARKEPLSELRERSISDETSSLALEAAAHVDFTMMLQVFDTWSRLTDNSPASLAQVGMFACKAPTLPEADYVRSFNDLVGPAWTGDGFRCAAVDTSTGELRLFGPDHGVAMDLAVASSCSVPGLFPPVTIGPSRYTDGGVRSGTNADLVAGSTHVLVLSPMGSFAADPLDVAAKLILDNEVADLRSAGSVVTTLLPDDETNAATMGSPFGRMDPGSRGPALEHGIRQGRSLASVLATAW